MTDIVKMITVSSAHIRPKTAALLDKESRRGNTGLGLAVYLKGSYGWYIYLPTKQTIEDEAAYFGEKDKVPEELNNLLNYAADMGCEVLCIDADGTIVPYLAAFDWSNPQSNKTAISETR